MPFKNTIALLTKPELSNNSTIGLSFAKGQLSEEELRHLNDNTEFPTNMYGQVDRNEENYNSMQAMNDFVNTVGPYMTDQALFSMTDKLCRIESFKGTDAFRNSTLAKVMINYEMNRYGKLTANIYHHLQYLQSMFKDNYNNDLDHNIKKFLSFNFSNFTFPEDAPNQLLNFDSKNYIVELSGFKESPIAELNDTISGYSKSSTDDNNNSNIPSDLFHQTRAFLSERTHSLSRLMHEKKSEKSNATNLILSQVKLKSEIAEIDNQLDLLEIKIQSKEKLVESLRETPSSIDRETHKDLTTLRLTKGRLLFERSEKLELMGDNSNVNLNSDYTLTEVQKIALKPVIEKCIFESDQLEIKINRGYLKFDYDKPSFDSDVVGIISNKEKLNEIHDIHHCLNKLMKNQMTPIHWERLKKQKEFFTSDHWKLLCQINHSTTSFKDDSDNQTSENSHDNTNKEVLHRYVHRM